MQIEIKINGEAAELQDVLRALLTTQTVTTTMAAHTEGFQETVARVRATTRKAGGHIKVEEPVLAAKVDTEAIKEQPETQSAFKDVAPDLAISAAEPQTAISFEEFRKAVGAAALKNKADVKAIIVDKYKAPRTADVKPEDYAAIIEELKAL